MILLANQREGGNFPIQSTVGDTMRIAMTATCAQFRAQQMQSYLINQIHDALMALAPADELDQAIAIMTKAMSDVAIPMPDGTELKLGVDLDVYVRWGEKVKKV